MEVTLLLPQELGKIVFSLPRKGVYNEYFHNSLVFSAFPFIILG
jgi:hypothetical protein